MDWYVVDKDYIRYLIQFDSHVGYVEYGEKLKLHVGVLLTVNSYHYYVPISSAKPKHQRMSNSLDFHKLQDAETGYLYAVLNLNNMIPVPDSCITQLKYNRVDQFRSFSNEKEKKRLYLPAPERKSHYRQHAIYHTAQSGEIVCEVPSYPRFFPRFQMLRFQIAGTKKQYIFKIKTDSFYSLSLTEETVFLIK